MAQYLWDEIRPDFAFADGGMQKLLFEDMEQKYCPVDINLPALNKHLGNFNSYEGIGLGSLIVLGGAPGSLKTTVGLWMMRCAAKTHAIRPVFVSYEMKMRDFRLRLAQGFFKHIPRHDFVPKKLSPEMVVKLNEWYKENPPDFDPEFVRLRNRDLDYLLRAIGQYREMGYNWIIFDNIQKVTVKGVRDTDYAVKVEEIMFALEDVVTQDSHDLMTIVGLSQINRLASRNRYESPTKHDLLGGTAIESQATQVFMLDHARQRYDPQDNATRSFLLVEKNRDGPQFLSIPFEMRWKDMTMEQGYPDQEHLWPDYPKRRDG